MTRQCTVHFNGLKKGKPAENEDPSSEFSTAITLPSGSTLQDVWKALQEQGYKDPFSVSNDNRSFLITSTKPKEVLPDQIKVVAGESTNEFEINVNETFINQANRQYGTPVEFDISDFRSGDPKRPKRMIKDSRGFRISFQRTPRMPDDNKLHQLPGSLGSYDLFNVEAYAHRLPANIRDAGGVFLPMWQREAMWINFEMSRSMRAAKYAIRVFVGRINAVSGLQMDEDPAKEGDHLKQDYVVIPGQRWLDGICVAPGVVRQFVAMPLGSGYTVEGQKTSEEKYGGLQIEVIPEYQTNLRLWVADGDVSSKSNHISEMKTPADEGLSPGSIVRSYPAVTAELVPCTIDDMIAENASTIYSAYYRAFQRMKTSHRLIERSLNPSRPAAPTPKEWIPPVQSSLTTDSIGSSAAFNKTPESKGVPFKVSRTRQFTSSGPVNDDLPSRPKRTPEGQLFEVDPTPAYSPFKSPLYYSGNNASSSLDYGALSTFSQTEPSSSPVSQLAKMKINSTTEDAKVEEEELSADVETADLKAMGLAAGGKLVQDIYKDKYPATTWNHSASRIINVHILDPASCEKVTHLVPLPPPIDAKSYADSGGKFFVVEEQVDNRVDGGDFEGVKSVSQMDKHIGVNKEEEFDPTKPSMCRECQIRLTDCILRPCNHQFCNVCVKALESERKCLSCKSSVSHVAGFSAPMNLPGEEPMRLKVPVNVLEINDGRVRFKSVQKTRI